MNYERSQYEAGLDIDYAIELHNRHLKLYRHMRWIFSLIFLVSGTAVFGGALAELGRLAKWMGASIAILALVDHLIAPSDKIARHLELKRRWCELQAEKSKMSLTELDQRMSTLLAEDIHIISALQKPSYNANLLRHGREEYLRKLNPWEWFVGVLS
jgi:hypothetical protein